MRTVPLSVGQPAPWITCRSGANPKFKFDTVAGRYVVLCFFGSAADPFSAGVLDGIASHRDRFDDENICFFGVSGDPDDERLGRARDQIPGIRFFWDFDGEVNALFGLTGERRVTYVLDTRLRVLAILSSGTDARDHVTRLMQVIDDLPGIGPRAMARVQAPILIVPRVFEPELCRKLIDVYEQCGGVDSGFMRDVDGKTTEIKDYGHKRRRDRTVEDEELRRACMYRIYDRLAPEIHKAFQFRATRMERYIVACYDAEERGHFRPHRDNTTKGTAHRRFAVSLFLNTGEYQGGFLRFPEFGRQLYSAPTGGAVVFSCSLLHEATVVTSGRRYMFLPFLYDDEAAAVRAENHQFLDDSTLAKSSDSPEIPAGPAGRPGTILDI
ncbi:MAG: 2OG-Fe(II) oxygenase [Gammaproteobacteria bacterium]|nr:2OG-Fe(II) oxygenase [Gammaproteobacteria bacterium]